MFSVLIFSINFGWVLDCHCTHHKVFLCFYYLFLHLNILGVAICADAHFLVLIPRYIVSDIGTWVTSQRTALSAVMSSSEYSKLSFADATVFVLSIRGPPHRHETSVCCINSGVREQRLTVSKFIMVSRMIMVVFHCVEDVERDTASQSILQ